MAEIISDNYYALYIYLDTFWRRRYLIAVSVLFTPILFLIGSQFLPQKYEANTSIAINDTAPPSMKDVVSTIDITQQYAGVKDHLLSPDVLNKVVGECKLLPRFANAKTIQGTSDDLRKNLSIILLEKSGIRIKLTQNSPNNLTCILNILGDILIKKLESQYSITTQSSTAVLESQLKQQEQLLKDAIGKRDDYQASHIDSLPGYKNIYLTRLGEISSNLGNIEASYHDLIVEEKELTSLLVKMNPSIGQIENNIRENDSKLSEMRLIYTDNAPVVKSVIQRGVSLRAEREKLYQQYQKVDETTIQKLWNMAIATTNNPNQTSNQVLISQLEQLRDLRLKIKGMVQKIVVLNKQQDDISTKLRLIDNTSQTLQELQLAVKNHQNSYQDTLARYSLTKLTSSMNSSEKSIHFQTVSSPQKPISSLAKPLSLIFELGLLSGILLGLGLALLFEFMDNTVRYRRSVEALTNLPVICRIEKLEAA